MDFKNFYLNESEVKFQIPPKLIKGIIMDFKNFYLNESEVKFQIPPKLIKYYKIDDNIRNSKNWQGKIIVLNNGRDKKVGEWDQVRYIAIDLNSNYIIPVPLHSEHQTGNDLIWELKDKNLIPKGNWVTIDSWGNNYIYNEEHSQLMLKAFKKFLEYGGDKNGRVQGMGSDYLGTIEDFIKRDGNIEVRKGELAKLGRDIVDSFEYLAKEYLRIDKIKSSHKTPREGDIIDFATACKHLLNQFLDYNGYNFILNVDNKKLKSYLNDDKINNWIKEIENYEIKLDYIGIAQVIFSANGLKNNLHQCLKIANTLGGYERRGFDSIFGDIETGINEFNRIAQI